MIKLKTGLIAILLAAFVIIICLQFINLFFSQEGNYGVLRGRRVIGNIEFISVQSRASISWQISDWRESIAQGEPPVTGIVGLQEWKTPEEMQQTLDYAERRLLHNFVFSILLYVVIPLFIIAITLFALFICFTWHSKCPRCKKYFGFSSARSSTAATGSQIVYVPVENKTRNLKGDIIETAEQHIPATRTFYQTTYNCRNCGSQKFNNWWKTKPHV